MDDARRYFESITAPHGRFERIPADRLAPLKGVPGLTATVSDVLERLGWALAVPASEVGPLSPGQRVIGQAVTIRYLPERRATTTSRLAHAYACSIARPGDVVVVDAGGERTFSVFGGLAAKGAKQAGLAGCVVYGACRDADALREAGLPVWSHGVTPRTGRYRVEAVEINGFVRCGPVQVRPGDVVTADDSGVAVIPPEIFGEVCEEVLRIAAREQGA